MAGVGKSSLVIPVKSRLAILASMSAYRNGRAAKAGAASALASKVRREIMSQMIPTPVPEQ